MKKSRLGILFLVTAILLLGASGCAQKPESRPAANNQPAQQAPAPGAAPAKEEKPKAEYGENLCLPFEEVLFAFQTEDSKKTLSVCLSKEPEYIVYRFGTPEGIELEYPKDKADSWNQFIYSFYQRGGAGGNEGQDLNYLTFENGGFTYQVFEEYTAADNKTQVGVRITEKATGKETEMMGVGGTATGSLIPLRDNEKIKKENM